MAKALEFSTILKEVEVKLTGKDNESKDYVIKELTGKQRQEYQEQFDVQVILDDDNKPIMTTGKDFKMWSDMDYLSRCLYEKGSDNSVGDKFVEALPGSVVKELAEEARKLSALDKASMLKAKNELEANTSNG